MPGVLDKAEFTVEQIADSQLFGEPQRLQRFFAWLRQENPVAWAEPNGHRPFWVVSRHDDIREIERQPMLFNAGPRSTLLPIEVEQANLALTGIEAGIESLVMIDGQRHQDLRLMTQDYFLPKNIRKLEAMVEGLAASFVDRVAELGPDLDIAGEVIFWYPLRVAMTVLGISPDEEARMLKLTHELFGSTDPAVRRPGMSQAEHLVAVNSDYTAFFEAITTDRLANPREDVGTMIAVGLPGEKALTARERMGYFIIVATAGHDTTAASIAGGVQALLENPALIDALKANPALIRPFANEAIRYTAPVKHFFRTVTQDYELRGKTLRKGDTVMLSYGAACRDEAVFEDAQTFRIDRPANNHLAFGFGPHQCLGQFLAKLEIEAFFQKLVPRIVSLRANGPALTTEAVFVSGLRTLPVHIELQSV